MLWFIQQPNLRVLPLILAFLISVFVGAFSIKLSLSFLTVFSYFGFIAIILSTVCEANKYFAFFSNSLEKHSASASAYSLESMMYASIISGACSMALRANSLA